MVHLIVFKKVRYGKEKKSALESEGKPGKSICHIWKRGEFFLVIYKGSYKSTTKELEM